MNKAPTFSLNLHDSNQTIHLSDFKGKPLIIQFWVSWCPDCIRELPLLEKFYQSMNIDEINILTINVTGREGSAEQRDQIIDSKSLTLPVLLDNGTEVYDRYECKSVPTTILLDADQYIQNRYTDQHRFQDVLYGISRLLT